LAEAVIDDTAVMIDDTTRCPIIAVVFVCGNPVGDAALGVPPTTTVGDAALGVPPTTKGGSANANR
jgi:hypothetical protein